MLFVGKTQLTLPLLTIQPDRDRPIIYSMTSLAYLVERCKELILACARSWAGTTGKEYLFLARVNALATLCYQAKV